MAALGDHAGSQSLCRIARAVDRPAVDDDDFVGQFLALEARLDARKQDAQVVAFVENGEDYGNIHESVRVQPKTYSYLRAKATLISGRLE